MRAERFSTARAFRCSIGQPWAGSLSRICATPENAPELEHLTELLGSVLDAARIARENRKKRGDALLQTVMEAIELAGAQRRLSPFHRMLLASAWRRNGLPAPASLEVTASDMMMADPPLGLQDRAAAEASLEELFRSLIEQSEGDALTLHAALTETFPAMPAAMREHVIACSIEQSEPIYARLACFWLLDPGAPNRRAAARALGGRAAAGALSAEVAAKMLILRTWMPQDNARAAVDEALKVAMRSGLGTGTSVTPWKIHSVMATLPNGGGAQSLMIALQSGDSRKTAMLLLKQGHGVTDAYTVPCKSATEQKALIQRISQETGAVKVPLSWLERSIAMTLADGLAAGLPPAPGLIEVCELCGLNKLRPEPVTTETLIAALPAAERICGLSAQVRGKLINASEDWRDRHEIVHAGSRKAIRRMRFLKAGIVPVRWTRHSGNGSRPSATSGHGWSLALPMCCRSPNTRTWIALRLRR